MTRRVPRNAIIMAAFALLAYSVTAPLVAQEPGSRWERRIEATTPPVTIFHATQVVNLPTGVTLGKGEWQFEIAHRFFPPVSDGKDAFWGLDGPALMRLALGYAPTDAAMVTLGRSNFQDNLDLQAKVRLYQGEGFGFPFTVATQFGTAWSTQVSGRKAVDELNFQYYGQLVLNARVGSRLAVGVVPAWLSAVAPDSEDRFQGLSWGFYSQYFLTDVLSLLGEWTVIDDRWDLEKDPGAFGIELETGGHFFKIFLTNSIRLNPSQYLAGSDRSFQPDEWRLGFSITRLLRF